MTVLTLPFRYKLAEVLALSEKCETKSSTLPVCFVIYRAVLRRFLAFNNLNKKSRHSANFLFFANRDVKFKELSGLSSMDKTNLIHTCSRHARDNVAKRSCRQRQQQTPRDEYRCARAAGRTHAPCFLYFLTAPRLISLHVDRSTFPRFMVIMIKLNVSALC